MKIIPIIVKSLPKNINYKKYLITLFILIVVGAFMAFYGVPQIVKIIVKYLMVLKPGHFVRKKHENKLAFTYKLYLWNVTNPKEISDGTEKPKMQEVGPYVFSQFKQKLPVNDNKTEDTTTFDLWNIYHFNSHLSEPLTGDEIVTLVNVVLVAGVVKLKIEQPQLIDAVAEGMNILFKNTSSIFVTMTAMEFINNGVEVDCNQTAYTAKVICGRMRRHKSLKMVNGDKNRLRYRWFDKLNNSIQARYTLLRGVKNIHDVGRLVNVNDEPKINIFKHDDKCNVINGTDKLYYPPFQKKDDLIWVYSDDACKSFPLRYKYMERVRGAKTAWKNLDIMDRLMNPECECNQYTGCSAPGTIDMYYCLDIFVMGGAPHFYSAEPSLLDTVEGMKPREHLHKSGIYFDLLTGSPILTFERYQISWLVRRIPEYHIFSSIAGDVHIPVLWYDESFSIEKSDLALVIFSSISKIVGVGTGYILLSVGILGCIMVIASRLYQNVAVDNEVPVVPIQ